ncbi:Zinc-uptake complex component A, substrate-binding [Amphibacillus marinus]|uniref:Zinc-uptake complex component A, substrate-binding n=1 Tax=Amphibacillus marinus TaxID=872970 RepID=A0A1H8Q1Z8_9BACI|nr:zinc ABC transporter substrate-binding protein [Amphibacillus marinus]SEO47954.1 Zinc-uptake complex component A, substrate-binding [Amphibacillus marinus]
MKLFFRALGMYITILVLVACGATEEDGQEDQTESVLQVYTTLYPLEYFTNEIGGEYVSVSSVLPPGSDAHTFEPTSRMMVEIAEADLFIFNDREMEAFAPQIQEALNNESVSFLEASANLEKMLYNHGHEDEDDHSHDHDHEDEGDHSHDHGHEDEGDHSHDHGHEDEGDHSHDHNHESDDDHNHDHDYEVKRITVIIMLMTITIMVSMTLMFG